MKEDVSTWERVAITVVDAILIIPLAVLAGWRHGRQRLQDAGLIEAPTLWKPNWEDPDWQKLLRNPSQAGTSVVMDVPTGDCENVISWVRAFEARHGHKPAVREVEERFGLARTTAWRRIRAA